MQLTPENTPLCLALLGCVQVDTPPVRRWYFPPSVFAARPVANSDAARKRLRALVRAVETGAIQPWWGGLEGEESLHIDASPDTPTYKIDFIRRACIAAVNETAEKL